MPHDFPRVASPPGIFLSRQIAVRWGGRAALRRGDGGFRRRFQGWKRGEACVARCGTGFASLRGWYPGAGGYSSDCSTRNSWPAVFIVLDDDAAVGIDEIEVEFFDHGVGRKAEEILRVEVFLETGADQFHAVARDCGRDLGFLPAVMDCRAAEIYLPASSVPCLRARR